MLLPQVSLNFMPDVLNLLEKNQKRGLGLFAFLSLWPFFLKQEFCASGPNKHHCLYSFIGSFIKTMNSNDF